ncbi:hypothetical protein DER45DRAFT_536009 [Fusarium avenaceum]|nr:hypothetical protein DER45DRAFT_536009 [Fusarium avenaceum]
MHFSSLLVLAAAFMPFAVADDCVQRATPCSPIAVCDSMSGLNVCGTTENASQCSKMVVPDNDSGSVSPSRADELVEEAGYLDISYKNCDALAADFKGKNLDRVDVGRYLTAIEKLHKE